MFKEKIKINYISLVLHKKTQSFCGCCCAFTTTMQTRKQGKSTEICYKTQLADGTPVAYCGGIKLKPPNTAQDEFILCTYIAFRPVENCLSFLFSPGPTRFDSMATAKGQTLRMRMT